MPQTMPMDEQMDDMYGNEGDTSSTDETNASTQESVDEENAGAAQILISKDQLPSGTKEGDECTFKVVKDFGDEFSLEYVSEEKEGEGEETEGYSEPMSEVQSDMNSLAEEGE